MDSPAPVSDQRQFPCSHCGANLQFAPGTIDLVCPHCGTRNAITGSIQNPQEHDFRAALAAQWDAEPLHDTLTVKCTTCGAESAFPSDITADFCPFCGSPIVAAAASRKLIKPHCLLPFHVTRDQAIASFRQWLTRLWFAPGSLIRNADTATIRGIYLPAWTYDSDTQTDYHGARGEDYWTSETYTAFVNGKTVTRTRAVRRTRWYPASGRVHNHFDDLLVLATESLPTRYVEALEPWDLKHAVSYSDEYLSGFLCQSYQVNLPDGFGRAKGIMEPSIRQTVCRDIGGDHQLIHSLSTEYQNITFKHLLLPVWLSAYRYHDKTYRFLVNARTGEVQGQRPWSVAKIIAAILVLLILIGVVTIVYSYR